MNYSFDISVVIVNYNVKDLLLQALGSLYKKTSPHLKLEVFVVDNQSSDDSVLLVRQQFPQVKLIANNYNAGFPAGNNQAFKEAKGKYIFMLNPDTEFLEDSLSVLFDYMESHSDISICAPRLLNTDKSHQISAWRYPSLKSIFGEMYYLNFLVNSKNYADKDLTQSFEAESFSGAAIFFRSELINEIGMLDETMFWIEDIDFCYRAKKAGKKLIYLPQTSIVHHSGQSAKKNYKISLSNQIFNKIKFYQKHHGALATSAVKALSALHVITKFVVFSLLSPFNVIYFRKAQAYAYTFPRLFNPPKGIK
jgi:GT2 family glycosyltransferase